MAVIIKLHLSVWLSFSFCLSRPILFFFHFPGKNHGKTRNDIALFTRYFQLPKKSHGSAPGVVETKMQGRIGFRWKSWISTFFPRCCYRDDDGKNICRAIFLLRCSAVSEFCYTAIKVVAKLPSPFYKEQKGRYKVLLQIIFPYFGWSISSRCPGLEHVEFHLTMSERFWPQGPRPSAPRSRSSRSWARTCRSTRSRGTPSRSGTTRTGIGTMRPRSSRAWRIGKLPGSELFRNLDWKKMFVFDERNILTKYNLSLWFNYPNDRWGPWPGHQFDLSFLIIISLAEHLPE